MAHDIFLSYSSHDKTIADAVCATLETNGIRCWIAPRDVLPGLPYGEALIDALNRSKILVLIFSEGANSSNQVMREVERAVSKAIPIIPFRIEDVPLSKQMEYCISAIHWIDAMTPPLEKHILSLAKTLQNILSDINETNSSQHGTIDTNLGRPVKHNTVSIEKPFRRQVVQVAMAAIIIISLIIVISWSYKFAMSGKKPSGPTTSPSISRESTLPETAPTTTQPPSPAPVTRQDVKPELPKQPPEKLPNSMPSAPELPSVSQTAPENPHQPSSKGETPKQQPTTTTQEQWPPEKPEQTGAIPSVRQPGFSATSDAPLKSTTVNQDAAKRKPRLKQPSERADNTSISRSQPITPKTESTKPIPKEDHRSIDDIIFR